MTTTDRSIRHLMTEHAQAWADHDLEAIVSLYHPQATFSVAGKEGEHQGVDAVRRAFAGTLAAMPDLRFEERACHVGEDHYVVEMTLTAGRRDGQEPAVRRIGVDVYTFSDGLITSKRSYLLAS